MYTSPGISHPSFPKFLLKTFTLLLLVNTFVCQQVLAQVTENFSDGDFNASPPWSGDASKFSATTGQLRLSAPTTTDDAYLSTASESINDAVWEFTVRMDFNPSSTNFSYVILCSDKSDVSGSFNGYYVSIGALNDEVSLYRQQGSVRTKLIDGVDSRLNVSAVNVRIKVTRDQSGMWELYLDPNVTGTFLKEGTANDATIQSTSYFGLYCNYTSTRSDKFYFDNISVSGFPYVDTEAPAVEEVLPVDSQKLAIRFSEQLDEVSAENHENFDIEGFGPASDAQLRDDRRTVDVTFPFQFRNGVTSNIEVSSVTDTTGNTMMATRKSFLYFVPAPVAFKDIIINELLPDFEPRVGLPGGEFVEIYNRSVNPIDIEGWSITDGTSSAVLTGKILLPGDFLILVSTANASLFSEYTNVMPVTNFPTLNNSADKLKLRNTNEVIDSVNYSSGWYGDEDKQGGGWSLELINPTSDCKLDDNWIASVSSTGGTPGGSNSSVAIAKDNDGPVLTLIHQVNDSTLRLTFNETLAQSLDRNLVGINPNVAIRDARRSNFNQFEISFAEGVSKEKTYRLSFKGITDCSGNHVFSKDTVVLINVDSIPPKIDRVEVISPTSARLYFSELVLMRQISDTVNYGGLSGNAVVHAHYDSANNFATINFAKELQNGIRYDLSLSNVEDLNGNISELHTMLMYFKKESIVRRDVVFNELLADPLPVVGLPEDEFVELYNRSNNPVSLEGWQVTDRSSTATLPSWILLPGEYVVLSPKAMALANSLLMKNLPSLNNSRDTLMLISEDGVVIDSVVYEAGYYGDDEKSAGGWSLELRDPENICLKETNWTSSMNPLGGTPGERNSVGDTIVDVVGPMIQSARIINKKILEVTFNERVYATEEAIAAAQVSPLVEIDSMVVNGSSTVTLQTQGMDSDVTYKVILNNLFDCSGNVIRNTNNAFFLQLDTIPPKLQASQLLTSNKVQLTFSERLQIEHMQDVLRYTLVSILAHPDSIQIGEDEKTVIISFANAFQNGAPDTLVVHVTDINGNTATLKTSLMYFQGGSISAKDIVINEIFPDPTPSAGLPEYEFIEVYNRSVNPINLEGWIIEDGNGRAILKRKILLQGGHLILCHTSAAQAFDGFGDVLAVANFPSLSNGGEALVLRDASGFLIDSVYFSPEWYRDAEMRDGGYSLELIDPDFLCGEANNWVGTTSISGGTPGLQNSVKTNMHDFTGPEISTVEVISPDEVSVFFSEKLSAHSPAPHDVTIDAFRVSQVIFQDKALRSLRLVPGETLLPGRLYTMRFHKLFDCSGNHIHESKASLSFALPEDPIAGDIKINEILFNPYPGGADFVEIYNASNKYISLEQLVLRNITDSSTSLKSVGIPQLLAPSELVALTVDKSKIVQTYSSADEKRIAEVEALPSLNDEGGSLAIISREKVLDSLSYNDKMHSALIQNTEGISLERISLSEPNVQSNWRSANRSHGYATPGATNSNATPHEAIRNGVVTITPEVISPASGFQEFANIQYQFSQGGFIANVRVYDSSGRLIKQLAQNLSVGTEGTLRWDGDEDNGSRAPVGYYMLYFEAFDVSGKMEVYRERVAVAGRF